MDKKEIKAVQAAKDRFRKKYKPGAVGVIEGGYGRPVVRGPIATTPMCSEERNREFGCKPNEIAIVVRCSVAGMQYNHDDPGFPEAIGIDESKIPPPETWVVFPRVFEGYPIYYKCPE